MMLCNINQDFENLEPLADEVPACHKKSNLWYIVLLGAVLAENGIFVTVKTLTCWQTDPPFCNNYTQVCYITCKCSCYAKCGYQISTYRCLEFLCCDTCLLPESPWLLLLVCSNPCYSDSCVSTMSRLAVCQTAFAAQNSTICWSSLLCMVRRTWLWKAIS